MSGLFSRVNKDSVEKWKNGEWTYYRSQTDEAVSLLYNSCESGRCYIGEASRPLEVSIK
jgi:hypothetical protein